MIDLKLLELIRCPIDGQSLQLADKKLIEQLNERIGAAQIRDRSDQVVSERLEQGLITSDGTRIYPSRSGIPTLIAENAIETSTIETTAPE